LVSLRLESGHAVARAIPIREHKIEPLGQREENTLGKDTEFTVGPAATTLRPARSA